MQLSSLADTMHESAMTNDGHTMRNISNLKLTVLFKEWGDQPLKIGKKK